MDVNLFSLFIIGAILRCIHRTLSHIDPRKRQEELIAANKKLVSQNARLMALLGLQNRLMEESIQYRAASRRIIIQRTRKFELNRSTRAGPNHVEEQHHHSKLRSTRSFLLHPTQLIPHFTHSLADSGVLGSVLRQIQVPQPAKQFQTHHSIAKNATRSKNTFDLNKLNAFVPANTSLFTPTEKRLTFTSFQLAESPNNSC